MTVLCCAILVAGCGVGEVGPAAGAGDAVVAEDAASGYPLGLFDVAGSGKYRGKDAEAARVELLSRVMDRFDEIRPVIESELEWGRKCVAVDALLESESAPEIRWFLDQMVSSKMLDGMLAGDVSGREKEIARYVTLLIDRKSPNADLIYRSLDALRQHWPKRRLRAEASRAAAAADAWLREHCPECDTAGRTDRYGRVRDAQIRAVVQGLSRLLEVAGD